jgi:hypothetical protein
MNETMDAGVEMLEVRQHYPASTNQHDIEPPSLNDLGILPLDGGPPNTEFRVFRGRHIQMMALGVSIGTGVLYESGYHLSIGGPACAVLAYLWAGSVLYGVMESL